MCEKSFEIKQSTFSNARVGTQIPYSKDPSLLYLVRDMWTYVQRLHRLPCACSRKSMLALIMIYFFFGL